MHELARTRSPRLWRTAVLELVVVAGMLLIYRSTRLVTSHSSAVAVDNARALLSWERAMDLPNELVIQHLLLGSETLIRIANIYYATVHFPLTGAFLVWLFLRSRDHYYRMRTSLALLTGLALAIHVAFPLAPARMLSGRGFVDTAAMYGPSVYGSPKTDDLTNQFAAMPSLHFGWAVMVALGIIRVSRSRYRMLWIAHPVVTLLVIVGTANHYWLDALCAGALLLASEYIVAVWSRVGRRHPVAALAPALNSALPMPPAMCAATAGVGAATGSDWPQTRRGPPLGWAETLRSPGSILVTWERPRHGRVECSRLA